MMKIKPQGKELQQNARRELYYKAGELRWAG
jgi:hypothetical protein